MREQLQSFFGTDAAQLLGQAAGLDATQTQRALSLGLPMQLDALAEHAEQPEGRAQIAEAVGTLPPFASVAEALAAPGGADALTQAGELLAPTLLRGRADDIAQQVTRRVGGNAAGVQKVLQLALPLLLGLLGREGLSSVNADALLGRVRGKLGDLSLAAGGAVAGGVVAGATAGVAQATGTMAATPANPAPSSPSAPEMGGTPTPGGAVLGAGALTPASVLDSLRAAFTGKEAEALGRAAGFSGSGAGRAVQGALPVLLYALAGKGRSEAGASDLLARSRDFEGWVGEAGSLKAEQLGDAAALGKLETQGRSQLGGLFSNLDGLTGRLGTALGGGGQSASKLLALMAPLLMGLLGTQARAGKMTPLVFSNLLGAVGDKANSLIPEGMGGIGALLTPALLAGGAAAAAPASVGAAKPTPTPGQNVTVQTTPPAVTPPPPPVVTATPATLATAEPARRSGFPLWLLIPLLALLLGGCWLLNRPKTDTAPTATTATANGQDIVVENPQTDAQLPPEAFTMSGKAPADMVLRIEDQGQEVASATADASGNWTAEIPAPTPGEHTYSIIGGDTAKSEFKVNIVDGANGTGTTGTGTTNAGGAAAGATAFAVTEPAQGAEVSGTGFSLKGTGTPGATYELVEDGVSVGRFKVGDDGQWTTDVAAAAAGARKYVVRDEQGQEVATLPLTVAAAAASTDCQETLSVSLQDGETVTAPFRFGGVGSGKAYNVTVIRGGRVVGTKAIPLGAGCTWSYASNPGGRPGAVNPVTYEVRSGDKAATDPADVVLNLQVRSAQ